VLAIYRSLSRENTNDPALRVDLIVYLISIINEFPELSKFTPTSSKITLFSYLFMTLVISCCIRIDVIGVAGSNKRSVTPETISG